VTIIEWIVWIALFASGPAVAVFGLKKLLPELPERFPDDGPVSRIARIVDAAVGLLEQTYLFLMLMFLVFVTCGWFITEQIAHNTSWKDVGTWFEGASYDVRYTCFLLAMVGGAFAAHHRRLLAMDFVSHFLGTRTRAISRVVNTVFATFIAGMFVKFGLYIYDYESSKHHKDHWMPVFGANAAMAMGAALLVFHLAIQVVIDIDYLVRKKMPVEPQMGAG